ncbi:MAG: hypothetical protein E6860_15000 [Clostridium sp.]|uniref:hypothetical protein n=1 Tax=Clostridium sp. TaxID=1506 RepID=UPI0028FFB36E|nr:hypothetical protein [Clostridium sp.]MDU1586842.1 hypothetical protein [Clostridium sp.]
MRREEQIDLEISKYKKKIKFIKAQEDCEKEIKKREEDKKREFRKNKIYLLIRCIGFNRKEVYKKYKIYKKTKYFAIEIDKKDKVEYIENKYRQFVDTNFKFMQEKVEFLENQREYLEDETSGIQGKDTNLSITYWLGIFVSLACSIVSTIFEAKYNSLALISLFIILAIYGFREIGKSAKKDNFKRNSLMAIELLLQGICKDYSENFELRRIENKLDIIEKQIDCFGEKRRSKKNFFDFLANRIIKR